MWGPAHSALVLPTSIMNKEMLHRHAPQASLMDSFGQLRLPFSDDSTLGRVGKA